MVQDRFTPPFSLTQQKTLAILPKVTSVPALVGASFLILDVCRKKTWRVYHRIMLLMSAMDFIYAMKCFVSTWIIPQEMDTWGARGNVRTCDVGGFFGHGAALSSAGYNGSLAIYFVMTVVCSWREDTLQKSGAETLMHALPLSVGWGTAAAALAMELNNPIGWTCWIGTYPPGCGLPAPWSPPCERGSVHAVDVHRWSLFHAELWFVFVFCAVSMIILVRHVQRQERSMERYAFRTGGSSDSSGERRNDLSQKVAVQASLYIIFFFLTWIFPMVQFVVANQTGYLLFPMLLLTVIFNPLQGFYDAVIYFRPRYLQHRAQTATGRPGIRAATRLPIVEERNSRFESMTKCFLSHDIEVEGEIMPEIPASHRMDKDSACKETAASVDGMPATAERTFQSSSAGDNG